MVGKLINDYLEEQGIKKISLIAKTGFSKGKIYDILKDRYKISVEDYYILCDALNVSPDRFKPDIEELKRQKALKR